MNNKNSVKPKPFLFILFLLLIFIVVAGVVLLFARFGEIRGFITAPRFSDIEYTHTNWSAPQMLALPINGSLGYIPTFVYRAEGTQLDIAKKLISDLEKKGYSLSGPPQCYGLAGDRYFFDSNRGKEGLSVYFFSELPQGDVSTSDIGCHRPTATYCIELNDFSRY